MQTGQKDHNGKWKMMSKWPGCSLQNLHWKLGQYTKLYWFDIDNGLKIFFRNNFFFVFQDRKLKLSESVWKRIQRNLPKFELNQTTKRKKNINYNCMNELNELKLYEDLRNLFSNRCWKFQLSILKNKKVLFLKKIFSNLLSLNIPI